MSDPNSRAARVRITGRVQGVGYRAWTVDEARRRGLSGWVRNLADGDVEAVFSGSAATVDDMIAACRRGPSSARVDHVMVDAAEPVSGPFKVLYER
jgi:acylphosphatase